MVDLLTVPGADTADYCFSELKIRPTHESTYGEWIDALTRVCSRSEACDYRLPNPHGSFAPIRTDGTLMLCIDGAAYMDAVADAIAQAKYEIFITDWWLSPEIFLKRPEGTDKWRLDMLLKRKAESGVRVCIMIYREVALAISINSRYASKHMSSLHRNIHVLRHPDHLRDSVLFWSHHEKLVVIDQSIAFMGGVDLCYGRWDRTDHPLLDLDRTSHTYERKQVKTVKMADAATKPMLLALMPLASTLPDPRVTNVVRTSRADVLITDMPLTPELPAQKSIQTGPSFDEFVSKPSETEQTSKMNLQSLVNSARMAVSWKRHAAISVAESDKGGLQLLSDGQLAYRKSTRRRGQLQREQTLDMYVPNVGHVAVPVDVPEKPTEAPVKLRRRHSSSARLLDRRRKRVRSYSVAGCTNIEMSAEQSTASGAVQAPQHEVPTTTATPRKSRPSRVENVERLVSHASEVCFKIFAPLTDRYFQKDYPPHLIRILLGSASCVDKLLKKKVFSVVLWSSVRALKGTRIACK
ncbi:unnamed protein product [Schistocephalus solidus]|uniref:phospholipase D n=1 Tax=Schistocephalus solidus TaxID=70667 RepID=A0A183T808_SCHSO|nr:unnamed protein product [Schistocephalus solidus]